MWKVFVRCRGRCQRPALLRFFCANEMASNKAVATAQPRRIRMLSILTQIMSTYVAAQTNGPQINAPTWVTLLFDISLMEGKTDNEIEESKIRGSYGKTFHRKSTAHSSHGDCARHSRRLHGRFADRTRSFWCGKDLRVIFSITITGMASSGYLQGIGRR